MRQCLSSNERIVGRSDPGLVLCRICRHWTLVLRVVLLDIVLVGLLWKRSVLLIKDLLAFSIINCYLMLNDRSVRSIRHLCAVLVVLVRSAYLLLMDGMLLLRARLVVLSGHCRTLVAVAMDEGLGGGMY